MNELKLMIPHIRDTWTRDFTVLIFERKTWLARWFHSRNSTDLLVSDFMENLYAVLILGLDLSCKMERKLI